MTKVNVLGLSAFSCYVLFFFLMTEKRTVLGMRILILISGLVIISLICQSRGPDDVFWSAMFACTSGLLTCASPLSSLRLVIKSRTTESLPFAFIACAFLNSLAWASYGHLADNRFVFLPNAIGSVIAGSQLALFLIYPSGRNYGDHHNSKTVSRSLFNTILKLRNFLQKFQWNNGTAFPVFHSFLAFFPGN